MSLVTLALLMLSPDAATANSADAPKPAAPAQAAEPAKKPKKICKMIGEESTGSRLGSRKVCMTAEQWKKADAE